jgi:5'-3' exoribonuclease 2
MIGHVSGLTLPFAGEDRQHANSKRRQEGDRQRGQPEPQHIKFDDKEEKGKMQLNGVEMVAVKTPAPAPIHPSLPAKPVHSVVTRLPGSGSSASEVVTTKRGISVIGGSAQSILDSRRANRMASINANLSAAEALKRELAGTTEETPEEPADPEVAPMTTGNDEDAEGEPEEYVEAPAVVDPDTPRGKKRKAATQEVIVGEVPVEDENAEDEDEDDEDAEGEEEDDAEDPPNPEADQPLPKKSKLQVNPDGTVDYEDTVM